MALIKCPECGNDISDQAPKCPKCGYVLNAETEKSTENADKKEKNKQQWKKYAPIIIALALVVVVFRFLNTENENNQGGTGSQGQNPTSSDTSSYTSSGTGSATAPSTEQGTYQGCVIYRDTKLGVSYEIPSNYKVYTGSKELTYVGKTFNGDKIQVPYVMLNWDSSYNNPVQYLNALTDALREAYSDIKITIEPLNAYVGEYLVYGIQYMYTNSGHTIVDNRYVTVINNEIFMITTNEENYNSEEINNVVSIMFKTLKVGS